jgi:hypothetical protein|tara:strand:+ start:77 stop:574 length:498 start_codon:yes stop_codon:yes gene_type:complete
MKYSQLILVFLGVMTLSSVEATPQDHVDHFVQHDLPVVWEGMKKTWHAIPTRKRSAWEGKKQVKYIPADLYRNYDEALFNVYQTRVENGFHIPKSTISGQDECIESPLFFISFLLGLAYGLQYDQKVKGACYTGLESSILALDSLFQMLYLILLPWEWPKLMLAF